MFGGVSMVGGGVWGREHGGGVSMVGLGVWGREHGGCGCLGA